jgi:uncharacterized phosphosugar-binding protein
MGATFIEAAAEGLKKLQDTQAEAMSQAAKLFADTIVAGGRIFSFGASHSFILTEEMVYRTGGLMLVNPLLPHGMSLFVRPMTLTSQIERVPNYGRVLVEASPLTHGDVLVIASTSGRNAVVIDAAAAALERRVKVIAITSMEYSRAVPSRHPTGKKLYELADLVIDNCAPEGDAAVEIEGFPQKTGPLSTLLGVAVVNTIVAETISRLVAQGVTPPVFISANLPGGDEHNQKLLEENKDRIFFM